MKKHLIPYTLYFILYTLFFSQPVGARERFFEVQSIDTMKYSRDVAREKAKDEKFNEEIDTQVKNISLTGATHVAVATAYDEEFLPFLKRWVNTARKYNLHVWFRGNFSGWEGWFEYEKIDRKTHIEKTRKFILENSDLFEDGDIFTSCPECENGGPGDPRMKGDLAGFRNFLIEEYKTTKEAFKTINKNVRSNYYSMNGDVARLVMNEETTKALDGAVTIDHYVSTPDRLIKDIKDFVQKSKGNVILGEFGAPIPDIHGDLSENDQAEWIDDALKKLILIPEVKGINYWTSRGSSTQLWNSDNSPRKAVSVLGKYYDPINISGLVKDELGTPLSRVEVRGENRIVTVKNGKYVLPVLVGESITFSKNGYVSINITVRDEATKDIAKDIVLAKSHPSFIDSLLKKIINLINILR